MPRSPTTVPVRVGDERELLIDGMGDGPDALARIGDYVVFVAGALPGERVRVAITSAARKHGRAELLAVLRPSAERRTPACRHFLHCGGCHLQHQDYEAQLRGKQARLQKELQHHLGGPLPEILPPIALPEPYGQRHKVVVHLHDGDGGRLQTCFHRRRSTALVAVRECPASEPSAWSLAQRAAAALRSLPLDAWHPLHRPNGWLRSLLVRCTTLGEAHLIVVATRLPVPGLEALVPELHQLGATTISANANDGDQARLLGRETVVLSGPTRIRERILGTTYLLSPTAFFQTTPDGAAAIVRTVLAALAPGATDDVADVYCGGGLLSLPLARAARSVRGIEQNPMAIADANAAARENRITNAQFVAAPAAIGLQRMVRGELPRPNLVALDPPRAGCDPEVLAAIGALRPRRIAYVSCEPATLARDLAALRSHGFHSTAVTPIDLFPQTSHLEAVACLQHSG